MHPLVGVIMGSRSDWETMEHAAATLTELEVPFEVRVVSAHRTPDLLFEYAASAEGRGLEVIIAGAGGAAHLPGMTSAKTVLPGPGVLGGGQLGRMLALAGYPLGLRFRFLDPASESPAGQLAERVLGDFRDTSHLDRFTVGLTVVTYEFENVPVELARTLERTLPV